MTESSRMPGILLITGGGVIAVCAATLGTRAALLGLGLAALAVVAVFLIRHPTVLLGTMIVVEVTNFSGVTQLPLISAMVGLGLLTLGMALRDPAKRRALLDRWAAVALILVGCYLATKALAVLGSQEIDVSTTHLMESVVDCTFLLVVLFLVRLTGRPWVVAQALVASLAALSLLSLANEMVFNGTQSFRGFANVTKATAELITTPRYAGPLADSNFWGRHLILGLPLAGALIVRAVRSQRWAAASVWAAAALAIVGGVYLTQSRGTLIATAVVLMVWVLASGPGARRIGLRSLPLMALVLVAPGIGNRLVVLAGDVFTSGHKYGVDLSVLQRTAAQEMSWAMFRDRPFFGVGPNAFEAMVPSYAGRAATAVLNPTDGPHNLYAQLAAESGLVGLVGWAIFVGSVIWLLARRVSRMSPMSAVSERSLAAAVLAALVGWSFASIFLHLAYFRTFAIILALALALIQPRGQHEVTPPPRDSSRMRQILVSCSLAAASAFAVLAVSGTPTHVATTTVTLLPTEPVTGQYAYALDMRSREAIVPTYAAMIAANAPGTAAVPDAVRGVVTLSVEDTDSESARAGLNVAWANAYRNLQLFGLDGQFTISQVGPVQNDVRVSQTPVSWAAAVLAAVATGLITMFLMLHYSARRPRRTEFVNRLTTMVDHDRRSAHHQRRQYDYLR